MKLELFNGDIKEVKFNQNLNTSIDLGADEAFIQITHSTLISGLVITLYDKSGYRSGTIVTTDKGLSVAIENFLSLVNTNTKILRE